MFLRSRRLEVERPNIEEETREGEGARAEVEDGLSNEGRLREEVEEVPPPAAEKGNVDSRR